MVKFSRIIFGTENNKDAAWDLRADDDAIVGHRSARALCKESARDFAHVRPKSQCRTRARRRVMISLYRMGPPPERTGWTILWLPSYRGKRAREIFVSFLFHGFLFKLYHVRATRTGVRSRVYLCSIVFRIIIIIVHSCSHVSFLEKQYRLSIFRRARVNL